MNFLDSVKVNLETFTRCGGSCQGCILNASERRSGLLWGEERLSHIEPLVRGFIAGHLERFDPVEVSINCGQGDHLLAEPGDLAKLVEWIAKVGNGRAIGFMTASAVGKSSRVRRAVDTIREASLRLDQPIMLDLVFDPAKTELAQFRDTYADNIAYVRSAFGGVDFAINIGPDTVATLSPEALHDFLRASDIARFTLNLTPTLASALVLAPEWNAVLAWVRRVLETFDPSSGYELNVSQVIATALVDSAMQPGQSARDVLDLVALSASRSLYIDDTDWIWHTQEGLGDIAMGRRIGHRPTHRIPLTAADAFETVEESARRFAVAVARPFASDPECSTCRYAPICVRTGGAALHATMAGAAKGNTCPTGMRPILSALEARQADLHALSFRKDHTHLPAGFSESSRPHAKPVRPERPGLGPLGGKASLEGSDLETSQVME